MTELFRIASAITNPWSLAAYAVASIVYIVSRRRGKVPVLVWVSIWLLVLIPAVASVYVEVARSGVTSIYRLRVTVVDPQHVPVEDARVWSSMGGEPKKVAGGWQFDIPTASKPEDGRLTVFASLPAAFLSGKQELILKDDYNPTVTIQLEADTSASVRGIVIDSSDEAIVGARVSVVGYEAGAVITEAGGNFVLPAHAADGQQVLLHAEKEGYQAISQWHPAGDEPATIILDRR